MLTPLALFSMPGPSDWIVIALVGLLFFGKRLPEVGRSLGKGIVEFKKGLKGIEEEVEDAVDAKSAAPTRSLETEHKFDPHTGKPLHKFDPYTGKPLFEESVETAQTKETVPPENFH